MSKILEKAFNAGQKIIRSVFRGSPNLITTSDLNRQIEALKYQIDSVENRVGVLSDATIETAYSSGTLSVSYQYSYLEAFGCSFPSKSAEVSINMTSSTGPAYLILTADTELVTYQTDFSHEIAGAKFEDGTSKEAADQMVAKNEAISLVHSLPTSGLVAVLCIFTLNESNKIVTRKNIIDKKSSVTINGSGVIRDWNPSIGNETIAAGMAYDRAINVLDCRTKGLSVFYKPSSYEEQESGFKAIMDSSVTFNEGALFMVSVGCIALYKGSGGHGNFTIVALARKSYGFQHLTSALYVAGSSGDSTQVAIKVGINWDSSPVQISISNDTEGVRIGRDDDTNIIFKYM